MNHARDFTQAILTAAFHQYLIEQIRQLVEVVGGVNIISCDFAQLIHKLPIIPNTQGNHSNVLVVLEVKQ